MRRELTIALCLTLALTGCSLFTTGDGTMIDVGPDSGAHDLIVIVSDMHDKAVDADPELSPEVAEDFKAQSSYVRDELLLRGVIGVQELRDNFDPVMDRYDAYVSSNPTYDEFMRDVFLGNTKELRELFNTAASYIE